MIFAVFNKNSQTYKYCLSPFFLFPGGFIKIVS